MPHWVAAMFASRAGSLAAAQAGGSPGLSRIGLELYTVRDLMATDYVGVLEKVAAIGYKEIEPAAATTIWRRGLSRIARRRRRKIFSTNLRRDPLVKPVRTMTARGLLTDIRHVFRRLVASPLFSLVALISLGLGIGANTAVVSVARAALFDTLPIERPEELSFVFWGPRIDGLSGMYSDGRPDPATGKQMTSNISFPAYQQLKQLERPGVSLGAFTFIPRTSRTWDSGRRPIQR
jgi:hypothetical protein